MALEFAEYEQNIPVSQYDTNINSLYEETSRGVSTGTTIMAVAFKGGVVMAADTRTSAGGLIVNRASRKISQLAERIFVCRSGSAADTQALTGYAKLYLEQHTMELGEMPRVNTAASLLQLLCYHNKDHLLAGMICAGWDPRKGGQVYSIPIGGAKMRVPYAAGGSGSTYVAGLLDATWRPGMSKEEAQEMAKKAVAHAMARDGGSGGMIRVTTITEDKVDEEVLTGNSLPYPPLNEEFE